MKTGRRTDIVINISSAPPEGVLGARGIELAPDAQIFKSKELLSGGALTSLRRLRRAGIRNLYILMDNLGMRGRMFFIKAFARLAGAEKTLVVGVAGGEEPVTWPGVALEGARFAFTWAASWAIALPLAAALKAATALIPKSPRRLDPLRARGVLYLRAQQHFVAVAGGALARISGVTGTIEKFGCRVHIATCAPMDSNLLPESRIIVPPSAALRENAEINLAVNSFTIYRQLARVWPRYNPGWFYHRFTMNNFTGPLAALLKRVPLVVEYNGNYEWMEKFWGGSGPKFPWLSQTIELFEMRCADVITVLSTALEDQLVSKGVDPAKIVVNPVGVRPEKYDYEKHREAARLWRDQLGIPPDAVVVGFVGSFGAWHGAEVLARAIPLVAKQIENARFLLVGQGPKYLDVVKLVEESGFKRRVILTGWVPQEEGPKALAACDILTSPHTPNPDGTPFFGSPMKLFEYMAMGRGIVASDLDQLGEVLEHEQTAILVKPSDPQALADGIVRLCLDPELRASLGARARRTACERHTWDIHIKRILERLEQRCGKADPPLVSD